MSIRHAKIFKVEEVANLFKIRPETMTQTRDLLIFAIGICTLARSAELFSMKVEDIEIKSDGFFIILHRKKKLVLIVQFSKFGFLVSFFWMESFGKFAKRSLSSSCEDEPLRNTIHWFHQPIGNSKFHRRREKKTPAFTHQKKPEIIYLLRKLIEISITKFLNNLGFLQYANPRLFIF